MKQKTFFAILSLLMLSLSSFAQAPVKGDVNEDGKVDEDDISAIIEIIKNGQNQPTYYWYVGTTKPTSLSQASIVTSYPAEQTYTNNSGAKSHIFVLTNSDKNVTFIEPNLNVVLDQESIDTSTISGYKIFTTSAKCANGGVTKIRITEVSDNN